MGTDRYRKILVATDLTESSKGAMETARTLASMSGAELIALHVYEPTFSTRPWLVPLEAADLETLTGYARREREAAHHLLTTELTGVSPADAHHGGPVAMIREGVAADTIVDTASELCVDLLVIGTHGRRGLERALLGSIAERVVRTASCPVLVVPKART